MHCPDSHGWRQISLMKVENQGLALTEGPDFAGIIEGWLAIGNQSTPG